MKFFIPATKDNEQAIQVYLGTVKFAEQQIGRKVTDRRIFQITYMHNSKEYTAEVGKSVALIHETAVAILETAGLYLICTQNRGVIRGEPFLVGEPSVISIMDFESSGDNGG